MAVVLFIIIHILSYGSKEKYNCQCYLIILMWYTIWQYTKNYLPLIFLVLKAFNSGIELLWQMPLI